MAAFPDEAWFKDYQARVNQDKELSVIGNWFSTRFSITVDQARRVLVVDKGQITQVIMTPKFDSRPAFGFQAPMSIWGKFLTPNPPPLYNDFFAMLMRVPDFVLEGDGLVAMQNARALQRLMNLMRKEAA
jgi:hypothetical protein